MSSLSDSDLLHNFLFHIRTPLSSIKGASRLAKQMNENLPISLLNWLDRWTPSVERWISAEEKVQISLQDSKQHDWKQIVYEMAKDMQDISTAFAEGQDLESPESPEGTIIMKLAFEGGFKYLSGIIEPILRKDYQHLLQ